MNTETRTERPLVQSLIAECKQHFFRYEPGLIEGTEVGKCKCGKTKVRRKS